MERSLAELFEYYEELNVAELLVDAKKYVLKLRRKSWKFWHGSLIWFIDLLKFICLFINLVKKNEKKKTTMTDSNFENGIEK